MAGIGPFLYENQLAHCDQHAKRHTAEKRGREDGFMQHSMPGDQKVPGSCAPSLSKAYILTTLRMGVQTASLRQLV